MDEYFSDRVKMQVLDFATDKRTVWEQNHQLYSVIFEITPKCNFNCVHCYLRDHHCSNELSYDEIIEVIDILFEKEVLFSRLRVETYLPGRTFWISISMPRKKDLLLSFTRMGR